MSGMPVVNHGSYLWGDRGEIVRSCRTSLSSYLVTKSEWRSSGDDRFSREILCHFVTKLVIHVPFW